MSIQICKKCLRNCLHLMLINRLISEQIFLRDEVYLKKVIIIITIHPTYRLKQMYWTDVYASWKIYLTLHIVRGLLWQYYKWRLKITFLQYKTCQKWQDREQKFLLCAHLLRSGGAPHIYFSHITHSSQSRQGWDECTISDSALI